MAARDRTPRVARDVERIPQLSCELCRERKVKCDKLSPCTNCRRAATHCRPVYRKRLPRGRHALRPSSDQELRDRIARLEAKIESMSNSPPRAGMLSSMKESAGMTPGTDESCREQKDLLVSSPSECDPAPFREESLSARRFWGDLLDEVQGLRVLIEQPSDDDEVEEDVLGGCNGTHSGHNSTFFRANFDSSGCRTLLSCGIVWQPPPTVCSRLCEVYLQRVDPVMKILHRPSLKKFMMNEGRYLRYQLGHPAPAALQAAVCYASVCSMDEEQLQSNFGVSQKEVLMRYRAVCEGALEKANLVTTRDITVLQAFVLYLSVTRTHDRSRAVWTLLPVAVRIARALSLHTEDHRRDESFFEAQIRKRLWHFLCLMDLQTSLAQATDPLIAFDWSQASFPRNVDDFDFDMDTSGDLMDKKGLTDMTYAQLTYRAQSTGRYLNFTSARDAGRNREGAPFKWEDRQKHVDHFERQALELVRGIDADSSPWAWLCVRGAQCLTASMKLSALRPLHRTDGSAPPRGHGSSDLLRVAVIMLENARMMRTDPRGEPFRWYIVLQWHALAIAISECFTCDDSELVQRVWPLIEESWSHHTSFFTNYKEGVLRRPMCMLMQQTREKVSQLSQPVRVNQSAPAQRSSAASCISPAVSSTTSTFNPTTPKLAMTEGVPDRISTLDVPLQQWHGPNNGLAGPVSQPFILTPTDYQPQPWTSEQSTRYQGYGPLTQQLHPEWSSTTSNIFDPAWGHWELFLDELAVHDVFGIPVPVSIYDTSFGPDMTGVQGQGYPQQ